MFIHLISVLHLCLIINSEINQSQEQRLIIQRKYSPIYGRQGGKGQVNTYIRKLMSQQTFLLGELIELHKTYGLVIHAGFISTIYIVYSKHLSLYQKMDFKNIFTKKEQEEQSCFPNLTFTERLIGFGICCVLGYILQILSFGAILSIATGNPAKFAVIYSLGNVLTLAATGFLIGFKKQIKNMADKDRRVTSIVFIVGLLGTLFSAIVLSSQLLVILFLLVQIPAYIWYCASYIPFARDCIKSCLRSCFGKITKSQEK